MPARTVVDRIAARARRPPLQPAELGRQARQVEQLDATRVQKRQQVVIQIALRSRGLLEFNPVLSESSTRPLASIPIANDLRYAITAAQGSALHDRSLRIERRSTFEQRVDNADTLRSRCAIAKVNESETPPDGSQKAA